MRKLNLARLIALPLAFATLFPCAWLLGATSIAGDGVKTGPLQSPSPHFERVFIIVLENTDFGQALATPFLRHLTTLGTLFTNFHAITHPSYPNYLAMATGSSLNIRSDAQEDLDTTSLADLLEAAGVSWKVYAENLPSPCFHGTVSPDGLYVRRHERYTARLTPASARHWNDWTSTHTHRMAWAFLHTHVPSRPSPQPCHTG